MSRDPINSAIDNAEVIFTGEEDFDQAAEPDAKVVAIGSHGLAAKVRARSVSGGNQLLTEDAAAVEFANRYDGKLRFDHDAGVWREWTGAVWRENKTGVAFHYARELARELAVAVPERTKVSAASTKFAKGVEQFARADPKFVATAEYWDRDLMLLGTPGGVIDLRTGLTRAGQPEDGITKLTAVAPADKSDCPLWKRFLAEATGGDVEKERFLQQWFGYSLTGDTSEHALVFIFGPGGNGKSVFLNVMTGILGDYAKTATMDAFIASKNDRHST